MYRSLRTGDGDKDRGTLNLMVSVGCGVRLRSKTRRWSRPRNHRPRVSPFPLPTANSGRNNYGDRVEFELSSLSRVNLQSTPRKFWRTFVSDPRVFVYTHRRSKPHLSLTLLVRNGPYKSIPGVFRGGILIPTPWRGTTATAICKYAR
jgi:hypothetical protein